MRTLSVFLIGSLTFLLLIGCSDKQKEAARLEQEMKDREAAADTMAGGEMTLEDSLAGLELVADASAIPDETVPEPLPMPPVPRGEGYTVQVASCENEEYARHLVGVYANRGYDAFVTTITYENQTYYRVRIGNFEGISEARTLQEELVDRFSEQPWIDRLDQ